MTADERIAREIQRLRYLSNDWDLTEHGFAGDVRTWVAAALCEQFPYTEDARKEIRAVCNALARLMQAIGSEDHSGMEDPDFEDGP